MPLTAIVAQAADTTSDIWKVAVPAASGLLGVVIGASIQAFSSYLVANQQRRFRLADEEADRRRTDEKIEADRSYARAVLARHLEAFARACANVMWENDDPESDNTSPIPDFPAWPEIAWELLGANEMMKARDVAVRVDMQRETARRAAWYGAVHPGEARGYYGEAAARIGLTAWNISQQMRQESGIEPFEFPAGSYGFAQALRDQVSRLDDLEQQRAERQAKGSDEPDLSL